MPINWKRAEQGKFDRAPERKPAQKVDPEWEALLTDLEEGQVVELLYDDMRERNSLARSIGRRAAGRKFRVELRYPTDEQVIVVRKSDQPYQEKPAKTPTNGRRRKAAAFEE